MAKKTAASKKVTAKAKPAKSGKPAPKAVKPAATAKAAKKVVAPPAKAKPVAKVLAVKEKVAKVKPALMTKKGKIAEPEAVEPAVKKVQTITAMIEADSSPEAADASKVEKISKVKPVRVDRGNLADEKVKWAELFKKYGKDKAAAYKMSESFPTLTPLQHKVLGWGFILTNENDRLEVLFENGIRMLISNYKS